MEGAGSSFFGGIRAICGEASFGHPGCGGSDEQRVQALGVRSVARGDCAQKLPGAGNSFMNYGLVLGIVSEVSIYTNIDSFYMFSKYRKWYVVRGISYRFFRCIKISNN